MTKVFDRLQEELMQIKSQLLALDGTSFKVHHDGTGSPKHGPQAIGKSRGCRNTKIHLMSADECTALAISLSPDQTHDGV